MALYAPQHRLYLCNWAPLAPAYDRLALRAEMGSLLF